MSDPIHNPNVKNSQAPTESEPDLLEENYGFEYDPDLDADYEDDFYSSDSGDSFVGPEEGGSSASSPQELRSWLDQLLANGQITQAQYTLWTNQINGASYLTPATQATELARISAEIGAVAPQSAAGGAEDPFGLDEALGDEGQGAVDIETLRKELNDFKTEIEGMENLTEDERVAAIAEVDRMINEMELDPQNIDGAGVRMGIEDLRAQLNEQNQFSPGVKGLSAATGMSPEEINAKAEAAGIDIDNLTLPPTMQVLDFLKEMDPELAAMAESVQDALDDRESALNDNLRGAQQQNTNNTRDTSDTDNQDPTYFQNLYDLKWHQGEVSQAVTNAKQAFVDALTPYLEALYPDAEITKVETPDVSGWERTYEEYLVADQLNIGGHVYDFFSESGGALQVSSSPDQAPDFDIPSLRFDNEGDGEWRPSSFVETYGSPWEYGHEYSRYDQANRDNGW